MKLYIDTTDREKIIVGIDEKRFDTLAKKASSQKLLPFIDEVLKSEGKNTKDLTEIEVNTGPGSYTGIRIGVSVANALASQLKIPVNGKLLELDIKY